MNYNKNINYLVISTFVLFLSLPTIFGLLLPKSTNDLIENRRLADLPTLPQDWQQLKKAPEKFDEYYSDHFGFRWSLLFIYRHIKYFIHDSPIKTAVFGNTKGWVFYDRKTNGDNINGYRNINRFSKKQLKLFIARILQKQRWLANKGIQYLFVIAPSKQYIYPEYLPDYIVRIDRQNLVIQLTDELSKYPEINYINLTPVLRNAKQNKLFYYKAGTHWNYLGTNVAQYAIASKLGDMFPKAILPVLHPNSIFKESTIQAGLAHSMGLGHFFEEADFIPELDKCATDYTPKNKVYNQTFTTQCPQGSLTALVFRDSFFTKLQPFMSLYFKNSQYIWQKMTFDAAEKTLLEINPDLVIEEWVDRYFPKSLSPTYQYKK